MNLGQLLLVVGALALLAALQLGIKSSIIGAAMSTYDGEATIEAISVGEAMVEEMQTQAYDSVTVFQLVTNPVLFTPASKLGPDVIYGPSPLDSEKTGVHVMALERAPFKSQLYYNDVDDYNGYSRIVSSPYLGDFTVRDSVYYVSETDQTTRSMTPTWFKKLVVTVTHPNLLYPVVIRSLVVYRKYINQG